MRPPKMLLWNCFRISPSKAGWMAHNLQVNGATGKQWENVVCSGLTTSLARRGLSAVPARAQPAAQPRVQYRPIQRANKTRLQYQQTTRTTTTTITTRSITTKSNNNLSSRGLFDKLCGVDALAIDTTSSLDSSGVVRRGDEIRKLIDWNIWRILYDFKRLYRFEWEFLIIIYELFNLPYLSIV